MFTTTIGWSISLCLLMIDWIMRAKLSVPPPAPEVTTNSTGLVGCQAWAVPAAPITMAPASAAVMLKLFMRCLPG